jgi:sugar phosphate isomerase/epimerase
MQYVGVPGIFPNPPATRETYRGLAREFDRYAERVADRGMRFYYHNHNFEFARDGGTRLYDILLDRTDPDLVFFEMDLYWTVTAGVDPLDYLARFDQSRFPLFHVKDRDAAGTFADLGEGNINFTRIFRELANKHYHHYFVERDTQANPARTAAVGYEYLRDLRGARRRKPYTTTEAGNAAAAS